MGLQVGIIKQDWLADLLLVAGNPFKDISILQQPQNLLLVMKDGKPVTRN
jgi:imidazolonepropionase-like amidohydrolase